MQLLANIHTPVTQVSVSTTARLHMGFYDLLHENRFGSLGVCLDSPVTQISIQKSEATLITAENDENDEHIVKIVDKFVKALNLKEHFTLNVKKAMPTHVGFGSGTQMALAIGAGLNQLFNLNLSVPQLAAIANRGKRSGIGMATFIQGGLIVDSGKTNGQLPEIANRQLVPERWHFLLISDSAHVGVHDAAELHAFKTLKPAPYSVKNLVLNNMIPAVARDDLLAFGAYMMDLQAYNGEYFAPIQGGHYASQDVSEVLAWLQQHGAPCIGQSSWGPTGFAIVGSAELAESLINKAQLEFAGKPNISFSVSRGKNTGATIQLA